MKQQKWHNAEGDLVYNRTTTYSCPNCRFSQSSIVVEKHKGFTRYVCPQCSTMWDVRVPKPIQFDELSPSLPKEIEAKNEVNMF